MRRKKAIFAKGKKVVNGMGITKRIKNVAQNKAQTYPEQMFSSCTFSFRAAPVLLSYCDTQCLSACVPLGLLHTWSLGPDKGLSSTAHVLRSRKIMSFPYAFHRISVLFLNFHLLVNSTSPQNPRRLLGWSM